MVTYSRNVSFDVIGQASFLHLTERTKITTSQETADTFVL